MAALITIEGVEKSFHGTKLLNGVSLVVDDAERIALVGPNGSGKSTLLSIMAGREQPEAGKRTLRRDLRLGWFEQEPSMPRGVSAREAIHLGASERTLILSELTQVHDSLSTVAHGRLDGMLARQAQLEAQLERFGGHDVEHRIEHMLRDLGIADPERSCDTMSGGERRRVALARLFFSAPDLLLLDEPTNHLDAFVTDWLEDRLLESAIPFVMVTHDRYFLDRVVTRIVEIDRSVLVSYDGNYGEYLEQRAERIETEEKSEAARANMLRRETVWMRRGAPARSTKQKARIERFHDLVDGKLDARGAALEFELPPGQRLGAKVIELSRAVAMRGTKRVIAPLDLSIRPGERIGIVGRNGAGKSTLLELCRGALAPASGSVVIGETVKFAWIDQTRSTLDPENTVVEEVAGKNDHVAVGDRSMHVAAFLEQFLFRGAMKHALIGRLSGGERNRVLLAKLLCQGGNVLVLDEPTNDLDLASLRMLEEALVAFTGTVLVVSHDRWFLDRVATKILLVDGAGGVREHVGDVSSLIEEISASAKAAEASTKPTPARVERVDEAPKKKKALAPWEQREYDGLLDKIGTLESELHTLDEKLADPALYSGPKHELERVNSRRSELKSAIETHYARWEELETI
ncbi:MAG: ABC-F family ATP-binding cassette domain-containing protein [Planctomycetota bacterium]|nr:ABC-F family ATP-binding cassette domain-containing protein [Planctomycetota bacterium]